MISLVSGDTLDGGVSSLEVLFNYSDDRLFHFFFEDMIFSLSVDFIEKFFLALVEFGYFLCFSELFVRDIYILFFKLVVKFFSH